MKLSQSININLKFLHLSGVLLLQDIDQNLNFSFNVVYVFPKEENPNYGIYGNGKYPEFEESLKNFAQLFSRHKNEDETNFGIEFHLEKYHSNDSSEIIFSEPIINSEFKLLFIYRIDSHQYAYFKKYELSTSRDNSIISAVINKFYDNLIELQKEDLYEINTKILLRHYSKDVVNEASKSFITNLILDLQRDSDSIDMNSIDYLSNFCDDIDKISELNYEKKEVKGKIVISAYQYPKTEKIVSFNEPPTLQNHRLLRKLLEGTSPNNDLILEKGKIVGYSHSSTNNFFKIDFMQPNTWSLSDANRIIAIYKSGKLALSQFKKIDDYFIENLKKNLNQFSESNLDLLSDTAKSLITSKHGSILIIHKNAREESLRLKKDCVKVEPFVLTPSLAKNLSSIDGAILIDPKCICYAFGVILDGNTIGTSNLERGSRFNSSQRYILNRRELKENVFAIVTSDDGNFDIL
ncbi:hypothetical protein EHQ23_02385 [Leptospira bourretii]|uniref:DAC domain-containing protein n=1 Tax=Leptospira bourretii TaxID=2484962 RepID=A0A4R9IMJ1_9LEPT|nr:diadenylate cyclase [Leptospira bourretii]TGK89984.1 hypothetical protein EHQ23_02385 [Leptospira bourretii]TGK92207.1 hypothetical protein EHQ26_09530 [Leptospira bourretii]TGL27486.1 hypothetical protein EHQ45_17480 [Leptospira bourretii]